MAISSTYLTGRMIDSNASSLADSIWRKLSEWFNQMTFITRLITIYYFRIITSTSTILSNHVLGIIFRGAEEQMINIHTSGFIALMTHKHPPRDISVCLDPGKPMGCYVFTHIVGCTIASPIYCLVPDDTFFHNLVVHGDSQ